MKNNFHIAFLIFAFDVLITPLQVLACEKMNHSVGMECCKKNKSVDNQKKDCCADKNLSKKHRTQNLNKNSKDNSDKSCGDCEHNCCPCAPSVLSFTIPSIFYLENKTFNPLKVSEKTSYTETYISSGFLSIWLPPKLV